MLKLRLDTFRKASEILTHIQQYSSIYSITDMPEWLISVIDCSKTQNSKIALVSTGTFLNILNFNQNEDRNSED